jgi:hypothetical protein
MRSTPFDRSDGPQAFAAGQLLVVLRRWRAVLWFVSAMVLVVPGRPVASRSQPLASTVAALSGAGGAGGLLLLTFGLLRFQALGDLIDLFTGAAFGALSAANLMTGVVGPIVEVPPSQPEVALLSVIFQRMLAGGLFLVGLAMAGSAVLPARRARLAAFATISVAVVSMVGGVALWAVNAVLPSAVDAATLHLPETGTPVRGLLSGQNVWLLLLDGLVAVLMLGAAAGFVKLARPLNDACTSSLAVVLCLLAVCQIYALVFPPLAGEYVSRADVLRLVA